MMYDLFVFGLKVPNFKLAGTDSGLASCEKKLYLYLAQFTEEASIRPMFEFIKS